MVTVILYAQPQDDNDIEFPREPSCTIEHFELQLGTKKLSLFQMIGLIFGVALLLLLNWHTYKKRASRARVKAAAATTIEHFNQGWPSQVDALYQNATGSNAAKATQATRKDSLKKALENVDKTLTAAAEATRTSISVLNLTTAEKKAVQDSFNKNYTANVDTIQETAKAHLLKKYVNDQKANLATRILSEATALHTNELITPTNLKTLENVLASPRAPLPVQKQTGGWFQRWFRRA